MDTLSEIERDDFPQQQEHRLWQTMPAGLLAAAGGGCVAAGLFQRYGSSDGRTLRAMATLPDWRLYVGLAAAAGICGLIAVVGGRTALARTAAGMIALPAVLLAALNAGAAIRALTPLVRADGVQAIGPGAWLTLGGAAAGLLAALLVLGHAGGYADPAFGAAAPALAVLGAAGLLHSWLAGMVGGGTQQSAYLAALTTEDHSGAATLAVVGGLGLAAVGLGAVSGRRSAVAAGVALGGAVAAAVDLGVRLATVQRLLDAGGGAVRRQETFIALGATVLVLLVLAVVLRGRPVPADDYERAYQDQGFRADAPFDPVGARAYGAPDPVGPPYGPGGERPYPDAGFDRPGGSPFDPPGGPPFVPPGGTGRRGEVYLPEHDPAPGERYPLVPDERAAHHPAPPRSGPGRSSDD